MNKKKITLSIIIAALLVLIIPVSVLVTTAALPSCYKDSYYAELPAMYQGLKKAKGKKIVVIGNSNVAFGVNSAYLGQMLQESGQDYTVCNFGLYGAIGTKAMLELSEAEIKKDDIVLFAPEPYVQSMSNYFSGLEMWRCLDLDFSLYWPLAEKSAITGAYLSYSAEKFHFAKSGETMGNGVYAKASFDQNNDMTQAQRNYNILPAGYDENTTVDFSKKIWDDDFAEYAKSYYERMKKKGAQMYFSFCPVNRRAALEQESLDDYYDRVSADFGMPILGNPHQYLMDHEWFYDSNFHLNYSGMFARTIQLYTDLMISVFRQTPSWDYSLPEKPVPEQEDFGDGDNSDADKFTYVYSENYGGYLVDSVLPEARNSTELTLPVVYGEEPIVGYSPTAIQGLSSLKKLIVQKNIRMLYNDSFHGCSSLREIYIRQDDPNKIGTGYEVLNGTADCYFYVPKSALAKFYGHYAWGHLADHIKGYEE